MTYLVIPAKAGTSAKQRLCQMSRDPGLRRGDGLGEPS
jgi:hypothetical protein